MTFPKWVQKASSNKSKMVPKPYNHKKVLLDQYLQFHEEIKNNRRLLKVHVMMHISPGATYMTIESRDYHQPVECQTALRSHFAESLQMVHAHTGNVANFTIISHQYTST